MSRGKSLSLLTVTTLLAACSGNGSSINPSVTQVNLQTTTKLQFAVGTANFAADGVTGLNTVVTFRQQNGLSAVLANTPTITGPAGFSAPNTSSLINPVTGGPLIGDGDGGSGTDAGTNHISGTPQGPPSPPPAHTTFGMQGGAFAYGIEPLNSDQTGSGTYPGSPKLYVQPFYTSNAIPNVGGPPAYPFFNDGTYPSGFEGFAQGFDAFELTPVVGQYNLSVLVAAGNAANQTFKATASLKSATPLPTIPAPVFTEDGAGGGTATVAVPADPRITETTLYVLDVFSQFSPPNFYSIGPQAGHGTTLTFTLPDHLGPCTGVKGTGCQNNPGTQAPSIAPGSMGPGSGDSYVIYAISYDYPAFEASPPGSKSQTPAITGANGQADLSISSPTSGSY